MPNLLIPTGPGGQMTEVEIGVSTLAPTTQLVYTKTQFRALLTDAENTLLDNFNFAEFQAEVPAIRSLTVMERASVRSAIARFKDGEDVDRTNPVTVRFITALGALGLLAGPGRAVAILAGESP